MKPILQKWGLLALTLFTFFFLLGSRPLNEPDEGRYSEIAREMIETGDWLVPHLWYLPHLDKPPMTYWLVAVSMKFFGQNEWAVRLPVALAGVSGVFATFLLGCALGGRRVGIWSALILQSSLIYFVMARFLTTDILLAQFVAWAIYFWWRSWREAKLESEKPKAGKFFGWHLAGWAAIALGFLTKGPVALAIPFVAFVPLVILRRREMSAKLLFAGFLAGLVLCLFLAAPWFLAVFHQVPESEHYMIIGQAAGHLLGTTIKNRAGPPFYFFGILAAGLLPWTILLGWLWRRNHWRNLDALSRDGWLLLNVWAIFTFVLFSLSQAKLPAYILPIFPALAVMLALKFFSEENSTTAVSDVVWRIVLAGSMLLPAVFPLVMKFVFHEELSKWLDRQPEIIAAGIVLALTIFWPSRRWSAQTIAASVVALALIGLFIVVAELPQFETGLRRNQTLKPLGTALRGNFQPGTAVIVWQRLPEGLPFYSGGTISSTNRPYLGGMDLTQVPFAFPGNRERLGDLLLPDEAELRKMLASHRRVLIVAPLGTFEKFRRVDDPTAPNHLIARLGQWQLFSNE